MMPSELKKNDPRQARDFFARKIAFTTGPVELNRELEREADIVVIDVREEEDYRQGHVPGALNLPRERWNTLDGLDEAKLNVLYCYTHVCHLAATAAVEFAGKGYSVMEMDGGFEAWKENGLKIEKPARRAESATTARERSGMQTTGRGRREEVRGSGVYPVSGPWPRGKAELRTQAQWGRGVKPKRTRGLRGRLQRRP